MVHPVFRNYRQVLVYVSIWIFLLVAQSLLLIKIYELPTISVVKFGLIYFGLYASLGLAIWYPVRFIYQNENGSLSKVINFSGVAVGSILLVIVGTRSLFDIITPQNLNQFLLEKQSIPPLAILSTLLFLILFLGYYLILYSKNIRSRELEAEKLKTLVRESELNLLKYKLNPHFLFNSLNSISALTMTDPQKAQDMIIKLSEYLRYSLESGNENLRELSKELDNARLYMQIERIRFGDDIDFVEKISKKCLTQKVPGIILQPLIENAIKHGVQKKVNIVFQCEKTGNYLEITIQNDMDPNQNRIHGTGTGLHNVRSRMETLYGRNDLVVIRKKDTIFEIKLLIPQVYEQTGPDNDH